MQKVEGGHHHHVEVLRHLRSLHNARADDASSYDDFDLLPQGWGRVGGAAGVPEAHRPLKLPRSLVPLLVSRRFWADRGTCNSMTKRGRCRLGSSGRARSGG